nr:uncharacterized protein CTRU02_15636 [Colletotrichum truncatum]KAF6780842.1 hypothetical protein CTRU02_15636 [Colletotrichum truncatum]
MSSPFPTSEVFSLLWRFPGSLAESIFVATLLGTTFHRSRLLNPKSNLLAKKIDVLERWQREWIEWHERHASPDNDNCVFGELPDNDIPTSESSSNEGKEKEDVHSDEGELLRCCGTDRPKRALPLVIEASNTEYITIDDYVSALHPWLMGLRKDIIQADNLLGDRKAKEYEHLVFLHGPTSTTS